MTTSEITARECRFAVHIPTKSADVPDYHLIKEAVHHADGSITPNVRFVKDFKRSFGVLRKPLRRYKQKKEYEPIDNLMMYDCTQSELRRKVAIALDLAWSNAELNKLAESPYLYGSDISSTAIIKHQYMKKYPDAKSNFKVSFFDIETDMIHGTEDPILATIVFEDQVWVFCLASFIDGYYEPEVRVQEAVNKYLKTYFDKYNFKLAFVVCKDTVELIRKVFSKAHEMMPDFMAIWNMDFDIPRIIKTLEKYGVDPKDVFSDPTIPESLRFCKYKKGSTKKITASGQVKPKNPSEQWHSVYCPSSFYIIDAMCSYRFVRQGEQEKPDYKLDTILSEELGLRKLSFEQANEYKEGEWHTFMQSHYPFEYIAYNIFDCIGMYELEAKNSDLQSAVPVISGVTDFSAFNSQTKRFADAYHFFLLERNCLIGTIPPRKMEKDIDDEIVDEEDDVSDEDNDEELSKEAQFAISFEKDDVLSLKGWIVTLPAHLTVLGRNVVLESKRLLSMIRAFVYDSDAVSSYPTCTSVGNVSRETTVFEIIDIVGVEEVDFRAQNINLLQGHVNALEYANVMHGLPTPQQALALFNDL